MDFEIKNPVQNLDVMHLTNAIKKEMAIMKLEAPKHNSNDYLDFKVSKDKVFVIINEMIRRFMLALCLPLLYDKSKASLEQHIDSSMIQIIEEFVTFKKPLFNELAIIKLLSFLKNRIPKDLLDTQIQELCKEKRDFMNMLAEFRFITEWKLGLTVQHEMAKENILRRKWSTNDKIKSRILELLNQLQTEEQLHKDEAMMKSDEIKESKHKLESLQRSNNRNVSIIIEQSKFIMADICSRSKNREELLKKEATKVKTSFNALMKQDLESAQSLRLKRQSTENSLKLCIEKYDEEVGQRYNRTVELKKNIADAKLEYEECKDKFERQQIQYDNMLAKKEQEEMEIREQKLMLFLMNRAARIIQVWWRKILNKRKSKKGKGRKAKKK